MNEYKGYRLNVKNNLHFLSIIHNITEHCCDRWQYDIKRAESNEKFYLLKDNKVEAEIFGNFVFVDSKSELNKFFKKYSEIELNILAIEKENESKYYNEMRSHGFMINLADKKFKTQHLKDGSIVIFDSKNKVVGDFYKGAVRYDSECEKLTELVSGFN
ncbi:MAG: hypothetical protein AB7V77_02990 [Candidatus Woesearchaeota archaeon]